jgi:hypothetical protein
MSKTIVITGASDGIGAEAARALAGQAGVVWGVWWAQPGRRRWAGGGAPLPVLAQPVVQAGLISGEGGVQASSQSRTPVSFGTPTAVVHSRFAPPRSPWTSAPPVGLTMVTAASSALARRRPGPDISGYNTCWTWPAKAAQ